LSDTAEGIGWWKASDGKWYPPEQHPDWRPEVVPPAVDYEALNQDPDDPSPKKKDKSAEPEGLPAFSSVVPAETRTVVPSGAPQTKSLTLEDGRELDVLLAGPEWGIPIVFHHGTPFSAAPDQRAIDAATAQGMRMMVISRPGYAGSTVKPGRTVSDVVRDVEAVLDLLGHAHFYTVGWSGGGPHALACAALLPDRCMAAATLGGVAPFDAAGLDWLGGMAEENIEEFTAAQHGQPALEALLSRAAPGLADVTPGELVGSLGTLLSDVDKEGFTGEIAWYLAAAMRAALSNGTDGWRDDDLAFVRPWGFEVTTAGAPVAIWQGEQDRMVPPSHGRWLADHIPHARRWLLPDEGHVTLLSSFQRILDDLMDLARASTT